MRPATTWRPLRPRWSVNHRRVADLRRGRLLGRIPQGNSCRPRGTLSTRCAEGSPRSLPGGTARRSSPRHEGPRAQCAFPFPSSGACGFSASSPRPAYPRQPSMFRPDVPSSLPGGCVQKPPLLEPQKPSPGRRRQTTKDRHQRPRNAHRSVIVNRLRIGRQSRRFCGAVVRSEPFGPPPRPNSLLGRRGQTFSARSGSARPTRTSRTAFCQSSNAGRARVGQHLSTGIAVVDEMDRGAQYPASTNIGHTSVSALSIRPCSASNADRTCRGRCFRATRIETAHIERL